MSSRRNRDDEIVCMCGAYDHPHRLGGGACDGSAWCRSFRSIDSAECETCIHGGDTSCDVVDGLEPIGATCACVADELRTGWLAAEFGYLPLDMDGYYEKMHREYYSG